MSENMKDNFEVDDMTGTDEPRLTDEELEETEGGYFHTRVPVYKKVTLRCNRCGKKMNITMAEMFKARGTGCSCGGKFI